MMKSFFAALLLSSLLACGGSGTRTGTDPVLGTTTPTAAPSPTSTPPGPAPLILSVVPLDYTRLTVTFAEPVESTGADIPSNYGISPLRPSGASIVAALRDPSDPTRVHLTSTPLLPIPYTLTFRNQSAPFTGNGRVAFVTRSSGNGNLSSWTYASGMPGAFAADEICRVEASQAGFVGTFAAWISLTGNGGPPPPGQQVSAIARIGSDAGGWIRTDGFPFSEGMSSLTGGDQLAFVPLLLHPDGVPADPSAKVWTSTSPDGSPDYLAGDCNGWSEPANFTAGHGAAQAGRNDWTSLDVASCSMNAHLYCFQKSGGPQVPPHTIAGKRVFLTRNTYKGNLGGLSGADAICAAEASDAGWIGTVKAWLSDSTQDARDRITGVGPWRLPNGVPVAIDTIDLLDGSIFTPINQDASGSYHENGPVWTGTSENGTRLPETCSDWSSLGGSGVIGSSSATLGGDWTDPGNYLNNCQQQEARLYCFED
jgi:hypothetical protein